MASWRKQLMRLLKRMPGCRPYALLCTDEEYKYLCKYFGADNLGGVLIYDALKALKDKRGAA
jgi:hypothetical protein